MEKDDYYKSLLDEYNDLARGYYARLEPEPLPPGERPALKDLEKHAEAGIVKRGIARYLFTRHPDYSLKFYTCLGMPVVRKIVLGTVGRISKPGEGGTYRTDHTRSKLEAATNFAVNGSVFNEVVHTVAGSPAATFVAMDIAEGKYGATFWPNLVGAGLNYALAGLQRFNRAKMVKRIDAELQEGKHYRAGYENWLGIDARAVQNYRDSLPELPQPDSAEAAEAAPDLYKSR